MNILTLLEEHGITEEQFRAYFGLSDDVPNRVYGSIINRRDNDVLLRIMSEMMNDEKIVEEIKNCPIPYQQTALIDGMPEPPMTDEDKPVKKNK